MFTYKKVSEKWRVMKGDHINKLADGRAHDGGGYPELDDCLTHIRSINYTEVHAHEIQQFREQKQPEIKRKQPKIKLDIQRESESGDIIHGKLREPDQHRDGGGKRKRTSPKRKRSGQQVSA